MLNDGFQYLEQRDAQDNITKQGIVSKKSPFATADNTGIYDTIAENFRWLKEEIGGLYDTAEIKKIQDTITAMYNEMKKDPRWGSTAAQASAEEAIEAAKKAIAAKESAESSEKVSTANAQDAHKTYNDCQNVLSQTRVLLDKTNKDLIKRRDEANELFDRRTTETNKLFDNREAEATKLFKDKTDETNTLFNTRETEATKLFDEGDAKATALFDKRTQETNTLFDTRTNDTNALFDKRTQDTKDLFDKDTAAFTKLYTDDTAATEKLFADRTKEATALFDSGDAKATQLFDTRTAETNKLFDNREAEATNIFTNNEKVAGTRHEERIKEANNLFDTREQEANALFDTRKGEAEAIAKKAIEDVNNTLANSNQSALAAKASADAAAQTEKETEKLKTDTIAETTAIKDAAIAETGKIKDAAIADTTAIKNEAQAQEELAKKWAIATDSPDGVTDTSSPTQKTMSSRSWALYAQGRAEDANNSMQAAAASKSNAETASINAQQANTAAQAALTEVKQHVQDSEAKIDEALKEANAARDKNTNAMAYLGSVATYDDLPKTNKVGDVWRIENKDTQHKTAKGAKILWTGQQWEAIGGGGGSGSDNPLAFLQNEYLIEHMPDSPYVENFANPQMTDLDKSNIVIENGEAFALGSFCVEQKISFPSSKIDKKGIPDDGNLTNILPSPLEAIPKIPFLAFSFSDNGISRFHRARNSFYNPFIDLTGKDILTALANNSIDYISSLFFHESKSDYRYLVVKPFGFKKQNATFLITLDDNYLVDIFLDSAGKKHSIEVYAKRGSDSEKNGYNPINEKIKGFIAKMGALPHFSFSIKDFNDALKVDKPQYAFLPCNKKGDYMTCETVYDRMTRKNFKVMSEKNIYFRDMKSGKDGHTPLGEYDTFGGDDNYMLAGWRFVD